MNWIKYHVEICLEVSHKLILKFRKLKVKAANVFQKNWQDWGRGGDFAVPECD